jgi:hypothetical protein
MKKPLDRRTFLRGLGGVALSLPFLDAMSGCSSRGRGAAAVTAGSQTRAASTLPKRLIVMFSADGTIHDAWVPTGSETSFTLGQILDPLTPVQSDILVLDGIVNRAAQNGPGDDHQKGMGCMLTGTELLDGPFVGGNGGSAGFAGGISIDQTIANAIGGSTKFKSLEFGVKVEGSTVWDRMSYAGSNQPNPPESNPFAMFTRAFGDLGADPFGLAKLIAQRKTVLDAIQPDYASLSAKLGTADKAKLDAHLAAIRDIEMRLQSGGQLGGACAKPTLPGMFDYMADANYERAGQLQMDLLVMSLACDLTRVASIQFSSSVSDIPFTWLGITEGHHSLSHESDTNTSAQMQLVQINNWYAKQFLYLVNKLKSIPEGTGTMLDNTVVLWCNELAKGNAHSHQPMPFVMAGKCGGAIRPGRFLTYPSTTPHNNLLVSIMNAMDVPGNTFGNPAYCTGPLGNLA